MKTWKYIKVSLLKKHGFSKKNTPSFPILTRGTVELISSCPLLLSHVSAIRPPSAAFAKHLPYLHLSPASLHPWTQS